jgi:hypothetical protein
MSKYASQDFIELISKESICSKVTSECVVVEKDLEWRNNQTKSCRYRKFIQLCSSQLFIWSHFDAEIFDSQDFIEVHTKGIHMLYSHKWVYSGS